jgi:hypothetical protein
LWYVNRGFVVVFGKKEKVKRGGIFVERKKRLNIGEDLI